MAEGTRSVKIPVGMDTPRFQQPRFVEIPDGEIPLIHPGSTPDKQVQERWIAHVRIFDLSDQKDLADYMAVWQQHCDKIALVCLEKGPEWDKERNRFVSYMKWKTSEFLAPKI